MDCCGVYADQFDRDSALAGAQRYRERGLRGSGRIITDVLKARGVHGYRVVDFGGGVGGVSLELIKAGAGSAINVELSRSYRDAATALVLEAGLQDRVSLEVGDATDLAAGMGSADIVVLNRVVCCYPDGDRLMAVAAAAATRLLAVSFPSIHAGSRAVTRFENWLRARRGSEFRTFVHPRRTFDIPEQAGFREIYRRSRAVWSIRVWESTKMPG